MPSHSSRRVENASCIAIRLASLQRNPVTGSDGNGCCSPNAKRAAVRQHHCRFVAIGALGAHGHPCAGYRTSADRNPSIVTWIVGDNLAAVALAVAGTELTQGGFFLSFVPEKFGCQPRRVPLCLSGRNSDPSTSSHPRRARDMRAAAPPSVG